MDGPDTIVIEPGRKNNGLAELWRFRGLFYFLAWRDIKVRYKQTVVGIAWSVLRPFLAMVIFTIIFGRLAKFPSEGGTPYPVLVFSAMLPWQLFANALADTSNSLVSNSSMISKVFFPRLIIPISTVLVGLVDFLISFGLLILIMAWYRFLPDWQILLLPFFLLQALVTALGAGIWFAALNVKYRDFRYIVPFIIQFGLYISPVGFSSSVIPEKWRMVYSLNPMVGVIDGFRWAILGTETGLYLPGFLISAAFTGAIFLLGLVYFRRVEKSFADVI